MHKDYKNWTPIKSEIHNSRRRPFGCKEREIWICNIGENIGFEEDGKGKDFTRPVLVLRVFNHQFCHVIPLSTTEKRGKFYYAFDGHTGKISVALLSQSRAVDTARLREKIGIAAKEDFEKIKRQTRDLLFP